MKNNMKGKDTFYNYLNIFQSILCISSKLQKYTCVQMKPPITLTSNTHFSSYALNSPGNGVQAIVPQAHSSSRILSIPLNFMVLFADIVKSLLSAGIRKSNCITLERVISLIIDMYTYLPSSMVGVHNVWAPGEKVDLKHDMMQKCRNRKSRSLDRVSASCNGCNLNFPIGFYSTAYQASRLDQAGHIYLSRDKYETNSERVFVSMIALGKK